MENLIEQISSKENLLSLNGVTDEEINKAEQELNLRFSEEYKEYLKKFGIASFDSTELTGICNSKRLNVVNVTQNQWNNNSNVPHTMYVIEELNIDGVVIWQDEDDKIYQTISNSAPKLINFNLLDYLK